MPRTKYQGQRTNGGKAVSFCPLSLVLRPSKRSVTMALYVSPETKKAGETEFLKAVGQSRREFLKTFLAAGAAIPIGAAMYFGYKKLHGNPVSTALIGSGAEGGVLIGAHNPDYTEIVAICV